MYGGLVHALARIKQMRLGNRLRTGAGFHLKNISLFLKQNPISTVYIIDGY